MTVSELCGSILIGPGEKRLPRSDAAGCDGFRITGEGTLDGDGRKIWDEFWTRRNAAPDRKNFKNLSIPRARLALIENSRDVLVEGVTFKDSQFWNLHLYRCRDVLVQKRPLHRSRRRRTSSQHRWHRHRQLSGRHHSRLLFFGDRRLHRPQRLQRSLRPGGQGLHAKPWTQYFNLQGQLPPKSVVRNITLSEIRGRHGSLGVVEGNPGQTDISAITFEGIDVQLKSARLTTRDVRDLKGINILVSGQPFTPPSP